MEKKELRFEGFLSDISPDYEKYVRLIHDKLVQAGCLVKLQEAKSGLVVSFVHPATKKTVANFVSRKKGPVIRIYGDFSGSYMELLQTLPEGMIRDIEKSPLCKRLVDPTKCNSRCQMGYELTINGQRHQKCRFNCFMFAVNGENSPAILSLLESEMQGRAAG